jgi:hypothetical protein
MHLLFAVLRWVLARLAIVLLLAAAMRRASAAWRRTRTSAAARQRASRDVLPSLYERYPRALTATRRRIGLTTVPLDRIVGTLRNPSQNTADFLPLPRLRGRNWEGRWQRIIGATDRLTVLPPVDLARVGDDYYVADGHNRVAAARRAGMVEIDADVTELVLPGIEPAPYVPPPASALLGADEVIQAGEGRLSRTAEHRPAAEELTRRELTADLTQPVEEYE